jgi:hypothetical protein
MAGDLIVSIENTKPFQSPVLVETFLRAMLDCAPEEGRQYVIDTILATHGDPEALQAQANLWFNHFIVPSM